MKWNDSGIILTASRHGENAYLAKIFTESHGRHAGLVRGAKSSHARGIYQPGNIVSFQWNARLEEHLGNFNCELLHPTAARVMTDALRLAALSSACGMLEIALPERYIYTDLYGKFFDLIKEIDAKNSWPAAYARFELALLSELGFGLDLSACAVTGTTSNLKYVSPRSGRAVSATAGADWKEKLLPLPGFLIATPGNNPETSDILASLRLTGWFLESHLFVTVKMPAARERLLSRLRTGR